MTLSDEDLDDAAALKLRRARLRAFADQIQDAIEQIPMPQTPIEAHQPGAASPPRNAP